VFSLRDETTIWSGIEGLGDMTDTLSFIARYRLNLIGRLRLAVITSRRGKFDWFRTPSEPGATRARLYGPGCIRTGIARQVTSSNGGNMGTILLIVLILLLVGALPTWPYSTGWGYYPSGGLGLVVVILLILVVMGRV
jgi:uncharacterized protein DUF3309